MSPRASGLARAGRATAPRPAKGAFQPRLGSFRGNVRQRRVPPRGCLLRNWAESTMARRRRWRVAPAGMPERLCNGERCLARIENSSRRRRCLRFFSSACFMGNGLRPVIMTSWSGGSSGQPPLYHNNIIYAMTFYFQRIVKFYYVNMRIQVIL